MKSAISLMTLMAIAVSAGMAGTALAHPGGHDDEFQMPYRGYDCQTMAGSYDTQLKQKVSVTVFEGTVTITPAKGEAAVGECVSPVVEGQAVIPRAKFDFGSGFGEALAAADCCAVRLKGTSLVFEGAKGVEWKRRTAE
jgi:hypothetical protein